MRRNAKEVKVIHRWRADEFDGEIPIGGDEEMLGTAMKVASQVNGIQDSIAEATEIAMPVLKNAAWLNAHIAGPFLGINAAYKLGSDGYDSLKVEGGKIGYMLGSGLVNVFTNGAYGSMGNLVRGTTMAVGSGLLGVSAARKKLGHSNFYGPVLRNTAIACYTVAGVSYAYKKFMGGR